MKILHIINSLERGGAENLLTQMCLIDKKNIHEVIALKTCDYNGKLLENNNTIVHSLKLTNNPLSLIKLIQIFKIIRNFSPDLVHTWLYHSDLIGGIISKIIGVKKIYWNVRHSDVNSNKSKLLTRIIIKILSFLSNIIPNKIIFCSNESMKIHKKIGYNQSKSYLIHNGVDLNTFNVIDNINKYKDIHKISKDLVILGMVSRFHPLKDHKTLLNALSLVQKEGYKFECILVGNNMDINNKFIKKIIFENNLQSSIKLLGQKDEVQKIMNMLDIGILSTHSESFPNVLVELMACKVPCISSDQGAASYIVKNSGWIVPSQNVLKLKNSIIIAIEEFKLQEKWNLRRNKARCRVEQLFSIDLMLKRYNEEWTNNSI